MLPRRLLKFPNHLTKYLEFHLRYSQKVPEKPITVEHLQGTDSGISVLSLNIPKKKNALSSNLVQEINSAIELIEYESQTRVLLLRSLVPGVFCAGSYYF